MKLVLRAALTLALMLGVSSCAHFNQDNVDKARALLEACLRESWTQGEQAGRFGVACQAMNDWARQQGWHAQP
jgi:hypothetical protein